MQLVGFGAIAAILPLATQGMRLIKRRRIERPALRLGLWVAGIFATAATASLLPATDRWPLPSGLGGVAGDAILAVPRAIFAGSGVVVAIFGVAAAFVAILSVSGAAGLGFESENDIREAAFEEDDAPEHYGDDDDDRAGDPGFALISLGALIHIGLAMKAWGARLAERLRKRAAVAPIAPQTAPAHPRVEPTFDEMEAFQAYAPRRVRDLDEPADVVRRPEAPAPAAPKTAVAAAAAPARRVTRQPARAPMRVEAEIYDFPELELLTEPKKPAANVKVSEDILEQNARMLEGVLEDFGVRGEIINVRPGPVVTLYELEPAPGIKSSRVIGLADDIARSMSAVSARVAVVPGRNAIGIELPNAHREKVYLRELLAGQRLRRHRTRKLPLGARQEHRRRAGDRRSRHACRIC